MLRRNLIILTVALMFLTVSCAKKEGKKAEEQISHYTCSMHPTVKVSVEKYEKGSTSCPVCNMNLILVHKGKGSGEEQISHYTCSMHPSVKVSVEEYEKGSTQCPVCNMNLIPIYKEKGPAHEGKIPTIRLTPQEEALIEVETVEVRPRRLIKEINAAGKMDYDERKFAHVTAWISGRIDKLFVDYSGVEVKEGDPLVMLYSPDLVSTQQEYLLALETLEKVKGSQLSEIAKDAKSLVDSTKKRLLLWGIPEREIGRLEREKKASIHMKVYSPISGTVIKKAALEGQYIKEGSHLYTVADLSNLWMFADIYEYEMSWVKPGQEVEVVTPAYPGEVFSGKITFIDPVLHPQTRSVRIRADFPNLEGKLRPGMFVNAKISIPLNREDFPRMVGSSEHNEVLAIPVSALLDTGKRKLVYISEGGGNYKQREVEIGPRAGAYYPIVAGLSGGENVVTRANFLIDSQTQLTGDEAAVYDAAIGQEMKHKH
ncbi:MAG: efflux RND transporter periplasmic adaptor subunit [Deltaproteobacteria bacterium]|nr:MAG: efflux RND transporter periplasmic adaptor subunit [Deltaproteobacteria bacterium]